MRTIIVLIIILFSILTANAQGYYGNGPLFLSRKNIRDLKVSSVIATTYYRDSLFHPLSNFMFELKFDNSGNIVRRKYWSLNTIDIGKYLYLKLVVDTCFSSNSNNQRSYTCIGQSPIVKINQNKSRTSTYMNKIFTKLSSVGPKCKDPQENEENFAELYVDTSFLNKPPKTLHYVYNEMDSISFHKDTLIAFQITNGKMQLVIKSYKSETNVITTERAKFPGDSPSIVKQYLSSEGLVYKITQYLKNGYSSHLYFYNSENLHIKTEYYMHPLEQTTENGWMVFRTIYRYENGSR